MAIFNCKSCGGDLEIRDGTTVVTCEYCGRQQTVPSMDNEKKVNLFNRANRLRSKCDFDKAASVYESIVAEFPAESEAYWGLCLCKFGIEYVDDPATANKIPTCHRTSYESIFDDSNFDLACENADVERLTEGDTVVVESLSRLGRSTKDLIQLMELFNSKGVNLISLKESIDTTSSTGKLLFTLMSALTQFERDVIADRTREGLASARARGRKGGRPATDSEKIRRALKLYNSGEYSVREITELTGVRKSTLYKHLRK